MANDNCQFLKSRLGPTHPHQYGIRLIDCPVHASNIDKTLLIARTSFLHDKEVNAVQVHTYGYTYDSMLFLVISQYRKFAAIR